MRETFDLESKPTDVANALRASEARQAQLTAQLHEEVEFSGQLRAILDQRFSTGFPGVSGDAALRKLEANVKRSVTRTAKDERGKGSTFEKAKAEVETNALALVDKSGFKELTRRMREHLDLTMAKVYELKKPKLPPTLRAQ